MDSDGQAASISVMVPAGWTADGSYVGKDGMDHEPFLLVWQISNRFNDPCTDHTLLEPAPGPGVDELLETLASQRGITAGPITDVTIDGYRGKSVELTVELTAANTSCIGDDSLWIWASPDGGEHSAGVDEMNRIYALDIDGTRFTFAARVPARTTAADLAELAAILDSIDIEPAPAASTSP